MLRLSALITNQSLHAAGTLCRIMVGKDVNPAMTYIDKSLQQGKKMNDAHIHTDRCLKITKSSNEQI